MHSEEKSALLNEQEAEAKSSQYRDVKPRNDGVGGAAVAEPDTRGEQGIISREAALKVVEVSRTLVFQLDKNDRISLCL